MRLGIFHGDMEGIQKSGSRNRETDSPCQRGRMRSEVLSKATSSVTSTAFKATCGPTPSKGLKETEEIELPYASKGYFFLITI